jgi:hypothetical protein
MKYLAFAAAAALTVAVPSISHATTINITSSSFAPFGSKDGTLHLTSGGPFNGAAANFGQFKLDGTNVTAGNIAVTFYTYCVDLNQALLVPGTFTIQPLSTLFNAATSLNMTKLLANVTPTNADQSAAMQLAMWELAFDTSATKDVQGGANQGQFWVTTGTSATARTLANGYLANLGSWTVPVGGQAQLLYNAQNQSQIFYAVAAVPESATWTMMITGFGIVGASLRVRRRKTALAAA